MPAFPAGMLRLRIEVAQGLHKNTWRGVPSPEEVILAFTNMTPTSSATFSIVAFMARAMLKRERAGAVFCPCQSICDTRYVTWIQSDIYCRGGPI